MAYYGGFQSNAYQRNAYQIGGSSFVPVNSGGDWYIIRRRRRRQ